MGSDFHPDQIAVKTTQTQQVVRDGALGEQAADERHPRCRIHEPLGCKRGDGRVGRVGSVSEDRFQVRIDGSSLPV